MKELKAGDYVAVYEWRDANGVLHGARHGMSQSTSDSLVQLIAQKHAELRISTPPDPKLIASVDVKPGAIFGIDRAGPEARLAAQNPALVDVWHRECVANMAYVRDKIAKLDFPDLAAFAERKMREPEKIAQEKADFLRAPSEDAYEYPRVPFYANLTCQPPKGMNMKLTLDDADTKPKPMTGEYEHEYDRYAYGFGDHVVHIAGEVVHLLKERAKREPKQAIFDAFRTMAESVRTTRPKPKAFTPPTAPAQPRAMNWGKPEHDVLIDRLGFERIQRTSNGARYVMVAALLAPPRDAFAAPSLRIHAQAMQVMFEHVGSTTRTIDGQVMPCHEYREEVRAPQGKSQAFLDVDAMARALFDSDPRVIAHVNKVGERRKPVACARAAVVEHAAESLRLKPFFDRAWERGCFLENVPGADSERVWRLESEQRAKTLRSLLCPT